MVYAVFTEHHHLLTVLHLSLWILTHTVHKYLVTEVFLHFSDIYDITLRKFLKFSIVDIRAVKCQYLVVAVMTRSKHKRVVCRCRSELHIAGHALICLYYRVYLDAALLLSGFGMPADTLENSVGEQCNGRGINDSKPLYPFFSAVSSAVRGK